MERAESYLSTNECVNLTTIDRTTQSLEGKNIFNIVFNNNTVADTVWWLTVGGADNAMIADVNCYQSNGKTFYKANIKYYIIDVYDWDVNSSFSMLNECGWAKCFLSYGCYETSVTWEKGARYPSEINLEETTFDNISDTNLTLAYICGKVTFENSQLGEGIRKLIK